MPIDDIHCSAYKCF